MEIRILSEREVRATPDLENWVEQKFGSEEEFDLQDLALEVMDCVEAEMKQPDMVPKEGVGFALGEGKMWSYRGGLLAEDRIYRGFGGREPEVAQVLAALHDGGWLQRGLLRADPELDAAVVKAYRLPIEKAEKTLPTAAQRLAKKRPLVFSPHAAATILAGDHAAGALLYQILYWAPRRRKWRGGKLWILKSREEWCSEVHLTRHQYDRAFRKLKQQQLIDVERHYSRFPSHSFQVTTHVRPLSYVACGAVWWGKRPKAAQQRPVLSAGRTGMSRSRRLSAIRDNRSARKRPIGVRGSGRPGRPTKRSSL